MIFRPIPGYPGYSISACGQVMGPKGLRKEYFNAYGTQMVSIGVRGQTTKRSIAKLVREIWGENELSKV